MLASDPKVELRVFDVAGNASNTAVVTVDGPNFGTVPNLLAIDGPHGPAMIGRVQGPLVIMNGSPNGNLVNIAMGYYVLPANTPITIGEQFMPITGPLALRTIQGTFHELSQRTYMLGSTRDDSMVYQGTERVAAWGYHGNDTIVTGYHDDVLYGGTGINTLTGGRGADRIDVSLGTNTLVYAAGDSSLTNGVDVVSFAGMGESNPAPQTFRFAHEPASMGRFDSEAPVGASRNALLAVLDDAYQAAADGAGAAVLLTFPILDSFERINYLVVDTGDGAIDETDYVIQLVGTVPGMQVVDGEVVFGG